MYVLSYILGYGQLLVLDERLSVLLDVSWYCCNCSLYYWANKPNDDDDDDDELKRNSAGLLIIRDNNAACSNLRDGNHYAYIK